MKNSYPIGLMGIDIEDGVFLTITNKDLPVKRNKDKQKYDRVQPSGAQIKM